MKICLNDFYSGRLLINRWFFHFSAATTLTWPFSMSSQMQTAWICSHVVAGSGPGLMIGTWAFPSGHRRTPDVLVSITPAEGESVILSTFKYHVINITAEHWSHWCCLHLFLRVYSLHLRLLFASFGNIFVKLTHLVSLERFYVTDCEGYYFFICQEKGGNNKFINESKTWSDAQQYCSSFYDDLAFFPNSNLLYSAAEPQDFPVWIGLYRDGKVRS